MSVSSEFKALIIGDSHHSDIAPRRRIDSYCQDILAKETEIRDIVAERKPDRVIRLGDVFHMKTPSKVSHYLTSSLEIIWRGYKSEAHPIPEFHQTVLGNHDLKFDSLDSLQEQPIFGLVTSQVVGVIPEKPRCIGFAYGTPIMISAVHGYGNPDGADKSRYHTPHEGPESIYIKACHTPLVPDEMTIPGDLTHLSEVAGMGNDIYLIGHLHTMKFFKKFGDIWMVYPGAISRGALSDIEMSREVSITEIVIRSKADISFNTIPLKSVRPAVDVFKKQRFDAEESKSASAVNMDAYIEYIRRESSAVSSFDLRSTTTRAVADGAISQDSGHYLEGLYDKLELGPS